MKAQISFISLLALLTSCSTINSRDIASRGSEQFRLGKDEVFKMYDFCNKRLNPYPCNSQIVTILLSDLKSSNLIVEECYKRLPKLSNTHDLSSFGYAPKPIIQCLTAAKNAFPQIAESIQKAITSCEDYKKEADVEISKIADPKYPLENQKVPQDLKRQGVIACETSILEIE